MNKVQLANPYNPAKNYKAAHWFATPKFDGVRAVFIPQMGFFTRNDNPISASITWRESFTWRESLRTFAGHASCHSLMVNSYLLEKVFRHHKAQSLQHNMTKNQALNITFSRSVATSKDTQAMLKELPDFPETLIFRVNSEAIPNSFEAVEAACRKFTAMGYEGVVLRHPDVPYHEGQEQPLVEVQILQGG